MSNADASYWIDRLNMKPHKEGGYYSEVYQSPLLLQKKDLPPGFGGDRPVATHIYYLLTDSQTSAFHRIQSDELWHHYTGGTLTIHEIGKNGELKSHRLGVSHHPDERPFCIVQAGNWFGAAPDKQDGFVLVGCTVAPGFDFGEFELANIDALIRQFPQHANLILACNGKV